MTAVSGVCGRPSTFGSGGWTSRQGQGTR
jgi:hypothetical protein